jgi:hypothetical protein
LWVCKRPEIIEELSDLEGRVVVRMTVILVSLSEAGNY